jgi:hypothetical protein
MFEERLNQAINESEEEQNRLIQELASNPDETLDMLIQVLQRYNSYIKKNMAIKAIRLIGYPRNAPALPQLIDYAIDGNSESCGEARQALIELGSAVVTPALLKALLGVSDEKRDHLWAYRIEDVCMYFRNLEPAYSISCIPALIYMLSLHDLPHHPDTLTLLDVLEQLGVTHAPYALPVLITLVQKEGGNDVGQKAQALIASFPREVLEPYRLLLPFLQWN